MYKKGVFSMTILTLGSVRTRLAPAKQVHLKSSSTRLAAVPKKVGNASLEHTASKRLKQAPKFSLKNIITKLNPFKGKY